MAKLAMTGMPHRKEVKDSDTAARIAPISGAVRARLTASPLDTVGRIERDGLIDQPRKGVEEQQPGYGGCCRDEADQAPRRTHGEEVIR